MSSIIDGLLFAWNKNLDYAQRLVADLSDEQMSLQIVEDGPPANHPAWVLSHLNVYLPVLEGVIQGESFEDPKNHPFGMLSKPESDSSIYQSKSALMETFAEGHQRVAKLLTERGAEALDQPVQLERWAQMMPNSGIAIPYLMLLHENQHLGQLSAWRRVQKLPSV